MSWRNTSEEDHRRSKVTSRDSITMIENAVHPEMNRRVILVAFIETDRVCLIAARAGRKAFRDGRGDKIYVRDAPGSRERQTGQVPEVWHEARADEAEIEGVAIAERTCVE